MVASSGWKPKRSAPIDSPLLDYGTKLRELERKHREEQAALEDTQAAEVRRLWEECQKHARGQLLPAKTPAPGISKAANTVNDINSPPISGSAARTTATTKLKHPHTNSLGSAADKRIDVIDLTSLDRVNPRQAPLREFFNVRKSSATKTKSLPSDRTPEIATTRICKQQLDREAILKVPVKLPRDPTVLALQTLRKTGAFVKNALHTESLGGWGRKSSSAHSRIDDDVEMEDVSLTTEELNMNCLPRGPPSAVLGSSEGPSSGKSTVSASISSRPSKERPLDRQNGPDLYARFPYARMHKYKESNTSTRSLTDGNQGRLHYVLPKATAAEPPERTITPSGWRIRITPAVKNGRPSLMVQFKSSGIEMILRKRDDSTPSRQISDTPSSDNDNENDNMESLNPRTPGNPFKKPALPEKLSFSAPFVNRGRTREPSIASILSPGSATSAGSLARKRKEIALSDSDSDRKSGSEFELSPRPEDKPSSPRKRGPAKRARAGVAATGIQTTLDTAIPHTPPSKYIVKTPSTPTAPTTNRRANQGLASPLSPSVRTTFAKTTSKNLKPSYSQHDAGAIDQPVKENRSKRNSRQRAEEKIRQAAAEEERLMKLTEEEHLDEVEGMLRDTSRTPTPEASKAPSSDASRLLFGVPSGVPSRAPSRVSSHSRAGSAYSQVDWFKDRTNGDRSIAKSSISVKTVEYPSGSDSEAVSARFKIVKGAIVARSRKNEKMGMAKGRTKARPSRSDIPHVACEDEEMSGLAG